MWLSVPRFVSEGYLGAEWNDSRARLGHHQTSLVTRADLSGLRAKSLMLVHGMRDARVSLENTVALSERLVQHNIMFKQKVWEKPRDCKILGVEHFNTLECWVYIFCMNLNLWRDWKAKWCYCNLYFIQEGGKAKYSDNKHLPLVKPIKYLFQIFPGVGHNFRAIEKYFHKIVLNFIIDSFNHNEENDNQQSLETGIIEDISAWFI